MTMDLGKCHSHQSSRRHENAAGERSCPVPGSRRRRDKEPREPGQRRAARSGLVGLWPPRGALFLPPPPPPATHSCPPVGLPNHQGYNTT